MFKRAIIHHQRQLEFARQLQDKQAYIQEQSNARYWLGRCYLEQAIATRDITKAEFLFKQAIIHHQRQLELARQIKRGIFKSKIMHNLGLVVVIRNGR